MPCGDAGTRLGLGLKHHHVEAAHRRGARRHEPGEACADDQQIAGFAAHYGILRFQVRLSEPKITLERNDRACSARQRAGR
jgi:hypothetical protein